MRQYNVANTDIGSVFDIGISDPPLAYTLLNFCFGGRAPPQIISSMTPLRSSVENISILGFFRRVSAAQLGRAKKLHPTLRFSIASYRIDATIKDNNETDF